MSTSLPLASESGAPDHHRPLGLSLDFLDRVEAEDIFSPITSSYDCDKDPSFGFGFSEPYNEFTDPIQPQFAPPPAAASTNNYTRNYVFSTAYTLLSETGYKHHGPSIGSTSSRSWNGSSWQHGAHASIEDEMRNDDFFNLIRVICSDNQRAINTPIKRKAQDAAEGNTNEPQYGRVISLSSSGIEGMGHFIAAGGSSYVFKGEHVDEKNRPVFQRKSPKRTPNPKSVVTKRMVRTGFTSADTTPRQGASGFSTSSPISPVQSHPIPSPAYAPSDVSNATKTYLSELLLEARILTHPPIANLVSHFIELVSFRWDAGPSASPMVPRNGSESVQGEESQWATMWPGLNIENAEYGSLQHFFADVDKCAPQLTPENILQLKLSLLFDIAAALDFLHACGIVHGDVKAENVLIFGSTSPRGYSAKLTDFGCSLIFEQGDGILPEWRGNTFLWAAPECGLQSVIEEGGIGKTLLTDNYSFGWMAVRLVAFDGGNPFEQLDLNAGGGASALNFDTVASVRLGTEQFKASEGIVDEVLRCVKERMVEGNRDAMEMICEVVRGTLSPIPELRRPILLDLFSREMFHDQHNEWEDTIENTSWPARRISPIGSVDIPFLNEPVSANRYVIHQSLDFPTRQQILSHLTAKSDRLKSYAADDYPPQFLEFKGHLFYQIFLAHFHAFGTEYDVDKALHYLKKSIECAYGKATDLGQSVIDALEYSKHPTDQEHWPDDPGYHGFDMMPNISPDQLQSLELLLPQLLELAAGKSQHADLHRLADAWALNHSPDGCSLMYWIVRKFQDLEEGEITRLIKSLDMDINATEPPHDGSLFMEALKYGNYNALCAMMFEFGHDFTVKDKFGRTSLHHLCGMEYWDDPSIIDALAKLSIKAGCDVMEKDSFGVTPLMYAVDKNCYNAVRAILTSGKDQLTTEEMRNAIDLAVGTHSGFIACELFDSLQEVLDWKTACEYLRKACLFVDTLTAMKRHGSFYVREVGMTFRTLNDYLISGCSETERIRASVRRRKYTILLKMAGNLNIGYEMLRLALTNCFRDEDPDYLQTRVWSSMRLDPVRWAIMKGNRNVVKILLDDVLYWDDGPQPSGDQAVTEKSDAPTKDTQHQEETDKKVDEDDRLEADIWLSSLSLTRLAVLKACWDPEMIRYLLRKAEAYSHYPDCIGPYRYTFYSTTMDGMGCSHPLTGVFDLFQVAVFAGNYEVASMLHAYDRLLNPNLNPTESHHAEFVLTLVVRVPDTCLNLTPLNYLLTIIPPEEFSSRFNPNSETTVLHALACQQPRHPKYAAAVNRMHAYLIHRLPQLVKESLFKTESGIMRRWNSPLGMAVLYRNPTYLHLLLSIGNADPNATDAGRLSALDMVLMIRLADSPLPGTRELLVQFPALWSLVEEFTKEMLAVKYVESVIGEMVLLGDPEKEVRLAELGAMWRVERMYMLLVEAGAKALYWSDSLEVEVPDPREGVEGFRRWDYTVRKWLETMVDVEKRFGGMTLEEVVEVVGQEGDKEREKVDVN